MTGLLSQRGSILQIWPKCLPFVFAAIPYLIETGRCNPTGGALLGTF